MIGFKSTANEPIYDPDYVKILLKNDEGELRQFEHTLDFDGQRNHVV